MFTDFCEHVTTLRIFVLQLMAFVHTNLCKLNYSVWILGRKTLRTSQPCTKDILTYRLVAIHPNYSYVMLLNWMKMLIDTRFVPSPLMEIGNVDLIPVNNLNSKTTTRLMELGRSVSNWIMCRMNGNAGLYAYAYIHICNPIHTRIQGHVSFTAIVII